MSGEQSDQEDLVRISGSVGEIAGATQRLPAVFALLERLTDGVHDYVMERGGLDPQPTHLDVVHARCIDRAYNAIKALRLLLAHDYWEFAQAIVRQLFELLVNLEEIERWPDLERAAATYLRFGMVQAGREVLASTRYDIETERASAERAEAAERFEGLLADAFSEFRATNRRGDVRWSESWCSKTARQLAAETGGLRLVQYEVVFRSASTQAHGAPGAVTGWPTPMPADLDELRTRVSDDDRRIVETAVLAVTFYFEIWSHAQGVLPLPGELMNEVVSGFADFVNPGE